MYFAALCRKDKTHGNERNGSEFASLLHFERSCEFSFLDLRTSRQFDGSGHDRSHSCVTFLYVGFSLAGLLRTSVGQIITLLYASTGWSVLIFLLSLLQGLDPVRLGVLILALLILWYLLVNVRRLAAEAQTASALVADSHK